FWRFGKWVDVVIDDKLPTINGRLVFVQSKNQNEFWPALLEKAYAKVCGSYTDMNVGTPAEAMVDFTGGVHMCIQLSDPPPDLWELMSRAGNFGALLGCSTPQEVIGTTELTKPGYRPPSHDTKTLQKTWICIRVGHPGGSSENYSCCNRVLPPLGQQQTKGLIFKDPK
ncbi:hypothetical protein ILYODFUR_037115, partial [Ilyodon furcidens]